MDKRIAAGILNTTNAARGRPAPTRAYSRDWTPPDGKGTTYAIHAIPTPFWRQVRAKATREGVSLRALILGMLQAWLKDA